MKGRDLVILVDRRDRKLGTEEKMKAHSATSGRLHRAFSVFVFDDKGRTMLQQRSMIKYHSKGKWSNSCCSHPRPGEKIITAAHRRLSEEMGFDCKMREEFDFPYEADVGNGLREREYDHIVFGYYKGDPKPDKKEVKSWRWISLDDLEREIREHNERFTPWLMMMIGEVRRAYGKTKNSA